VWQYPDASNASALTAYYGTLANPDNDPLGEWCVVQPETCVRGLPYGQLPAPAQSSGGGGGGNTAAVGRRPPQPQFFDYAANASTSTTGSTSATSNASNAAANDADSSRSSAGDVFQSLVGGLLSGLLRPSDTLPLNVNLDEPGADTTTGSSNVTRIATAVTGEGGGSVMNVSTTAAGAEGIGSGAPGDLDTPVR
jgi:hypothetical protein